MKWPEWTVELLLVAVGIFLMVTAFYMGANRTEKESEWNKIYQKGFQAGEREGFDKGYLNCYNGLGLNWLGSYERFHEFIKEYGSIHGTPWNEFNLKEKVAIAMYGGSGSKLNRTELTDFCNAYGVKTELPENLYEYSDEKPIARITYFATEEILKEFSWNGMLIGKSIVEILTTDESGDYKEAVSYKVDTIMYLVVKDDGSVAEGVVVGR